MREYLCAFDVTQKFNTETLAFRRAFDQSRNIGNNVSIEISQIRIQGSKRIIPHFGTRVGKDIKKRRLAGIGKSNQPDIGKKLKFDSKIRLLTLASRTPFFWRGIVGTLKMLIAPSAVTTAKEQYSLVFFFESPYLIRLQIGDNRSHRQIKYKIFPLTAMKTCATSIFSPKSSPSRGKILSVLEYFRILSYGFDVPIVTAFFEINYEKRLRKSAENIIGIIPIQNNHSFVRTAFVIFDDCFFGKKQVFRLNNFPGEDFLGDGNAFLKHFIINLNLSPCSFRGEQGR